MANGKTETAPKKTDIDSEETEDSPFTTIQLSKEVADKVRVVARAKGTSAREFVELVLDKTFSGPEFKQAMQAIESLRKL